MPRLSQKAIIGANYLFASTMLISHIGGYVASGMGLFFTWNSWKSFFKERIGQILMIFLAYGLIRSFFSVEPSVGYAAMLGYFSQWLVPFLLGYALTDIKDAKRAFWIFFGLFYFILALSLLAYFGLFFKEIGQGNYLVNAQEGLLKGLRSHIAFAALCLVFSLLSFSQSIFSNEENSKKRVFFMVAALLALGTIFFTGSRGYYLAAAATYSVFGVFIAVKTGKWKLLLAFMIAAAVVIGTMYLAFPGLRSRIQKTGMSDGSVAGRFALYKVAFKEIKANPAFGVGPGQGTRQKTYFEGLSEAELALTRHGHLHSMYLNITAEFGITGLVLFLALFFEILRQLFIAGIKGNSFERALAIGVFWGLIGVMAGDSLDTLLRGPGTAMELFWLSGLAIGISKRSNG